MSPCVAQQKSSVQWLEEEFIFILDGAFAQWSYKAIKYSGQPYSCIDPKEHYLCPIYYLLVQTKCFTYVTGIFC